MHDIGMSPAEAMQPVLPNTRSLTDGKEIVGNITVAVKWRTPVTKMLLSW